jgi:hypothetical protein
MNILSANSKELAKYRDDAGIVQKTALQVIKDFAQFGFDVSLPGNMNMAYLELFRQLSPKIKSLLDTDMTKLFSLLYYIDLNENTIKKGLKEMADIPFSEVVTHLILERELKKVLTREHFKNSK